MIYTEASVSWHLKRLSKLVGGGDRNINFYAYAIMCRKYIMTVICLVPIGLVYTNSFVRL
jgi:hypothetical protein